MLTNRRPGRTGWVTIGLVACLVVVSSVAGLPASAKVNAQPRPDAVDASDLAFGDLFFGRGPLRHLRAFDKIGRDNGGNRAAGTPGHDASAAYVAKRMKALGYRTRLQPFAYTFTDDRNPPTLERLTPPAKPYATEVDFGSMTYSGSGDVGGELVAVDLLVPSPAPSASTSGCEPADFVGFPQGAVALVQRGTCTFRQKLDNATAAGAAAMVVFNEGNEGRTDVVSGTLSPPQATIPALGATFAVGDELRNGVLAGPTGLNVHLSTDILVEERPTNNVIAETPGGDADHTVVLGAHLDSVTEGPGINDNGSGSAMLLDIAQTYAGVKPWTRNKVRFIWFSAEEAGLLGSEHYVEALTPAAHDDIELMMNFDMVASPNYVRFVYDGDNSAFPANPPSVAPGPAGSGEIEQVFSRYFSGRNLATDSTPFNGRSDYGPFIEAGIPAGGLFTGAEGRKTEEQARVYGGTAGAPYDACYHQACDDIANVNAVVLRQMTAATAHAVFHFAIRNFDEKPLRQRTPTPLRSVSGQRSTDAGPGTS